MATTDSDPSHTVPPPHDSSADVPAIDSPTLPEVPSVSDVPSREEPIRRVVLFARPRPESVTTKEIDPSAAAEAQSPVLAAERPGVTVLPGVAAAQTEPDDDTEEESSSASASEEFVADLRESRPGVTEVRVQSYASDDDSGEVLPYEFDRPEDTPLCLICAIPRFLHGLLIIFVLFWKDRWPYLLFFNQANNFVGRDRSISVASVVVIVITLVDIVLAFVFYVVLFSIRGSILHPLRLIMDWDLLKEHRLHKWYFTCFATLITASLILIFLISLRYPSTSTIMFSEMLVELNCILPNTTCPEYAGTIIEKPEGLFWRLLFPTFKSVAVYVLGWLKLVYYNLIYDGLMAERHWEKMREMKQRGEAMPRLPCVNVCTVCFCGGSAGLLKSLVHTLLILREDRKIEDLRDRPALRHYHWFLYQGLKLTQIDSLKRFFFGIVDEVRKKDFVESFWFSQRSVFSYCGDWCRKEEPPDDGTKSLRVPLLDDTVPPKPDRMSKAEKDVIRRLSRLTKVDIPPEGEEEGEGEEGEDDDAPPPKKKEDPDAELVPFSLKLSRCLASPGESHWFFGLLWLCYVIVFRQLNVLLLYLALVSLTAAASAPVYITILVEGLIFLVIYLIVYRCSPLNCDNTTKILINWELLRGNRILKFLSAFWVIAWMLYAVVAFVLEQYFLQYQQWLERTRIDQIPSECSFNFLDAENGRMPIFLFADYTSLVWLPLKNGTEFLGVVWTLYAWTKLITTFFSVFLVAIFAFFDWIDGLVQYDSPSCLRYAANIHDLNVRERQRRRDVKAAALARQSDFSMGRIVLDEEPIFEESQVTLPTIPYGFVNLLLVDPQWQLEELFVVVLIVNEPKDCELLAKLPSLSTFQFDWVKGLSKEELHRLKRFFVPYLYDDAEEATRDVHFCLDYWHDFDYPCCCVPCTILKCARFCCVRNQPQKEDRFFSINSEAEIAGDADLQLIGD